MEETSLSSIMSMPGMTSTPAVLTKSDNGDFPEPGSSMIPLTYTTGGTPNGGAIVAGGVYDWMRRAGNRLNAEQAVNMVTEPLVNNGLPSLHHLLSQS